jgi:hypothetical protein
MVALMIFLAVYATVCTWFFIALLRWSRGSMQPCACGGSMGSSRVGFVHGAKMCYPFAESLSARSA